jgi:hypothetical protein
MSEPLIPSDPPVPTDPVVPSRRRWRRDPAATRARWAERLQRFRTSGLTVAQFCAQEGVSVPTFYASTRALRAATSTDGPAPQTPELVSVRIAPPAPTLEVVLPSGAILRWSAELDPTRLATLLRAVGAISC